MHLLSSNLLPPLQLVLCDSEVQDLIFQRLQPLLQLVLGDGLGLLCLLGHGLQPHLCVASERARERQK